MVLREAWPLTQHIHSMPWLPEAPTGQEQIVSHLAEWHHSGLLKLEFKYIISGNERGEEEKWSTTPFFPPLRPQPPFFFTLHAAAFLDKRQSVKHMQSFHSCLVSFRRSHLFQSVIHLSPE